jgi:hypothetical protein
MKSLSFRENIWNLTRNVYLMSIFSITTSRYQRHILVWYSGQICTKIYDKRDDFNFKIINFPNMCSKITASPAYCVYISQLIRYARASSNYSNFLKRHLHLRNRSLRLKVSGCHYNSIYNNTWTKQVKQLSNQRQMSKTLLRHTLIKKIFLTFFLKYCYSDSRKLWAVTKGGGLAL